MAHPDLPAEQTYVDEAYDCLDRMREALMQAAEAGSSEVAAEAIETWATGRLRTFADCHVDHCLAGLVDLTELRQWLVHDRRIDLLADDERGVGGVRCAHCNIRHIFRLQAGVLEHGVVEHRFGQQLLQLGVLVLQCLQPLGIGHLEAAELGLPFVEGGAADSVLAAHVGRLRPSFLLPQDPDDLFFREPARLHVHPPSR